MSFTATISMSLVPAARWASTARQKFRPIRPKPFTPTRSVTLTPSLFTAARCGRAKSSSGRVHGRGTLCGQRLGPLGVAGQYERGRGEVLGGGVAVGDHDRRQAGAGGGRQPDLGVLDGQHVRRVETQ